MRIFALILISLLASPSFADQVTCYENGKVIYKEKVKEITFYDDMFTFVESKTNTTVFVLGGTCVIKL